MQSFCTKPVQLDDGVQPGCYLRADADAVAGGDGGCYDEHKVSEHRGGNIDRELQQGESCFFFNFKQKST